ncbi:MAG: ADP-glyceromanno-heptose 6-epimerase [Bacteroidales bacterium]|jgi:ADP-L-glycero-D-manno-heptose 6-epimerase|nr:ADP-glyceromanno-heptose 6-epimerase [Bacteroidales bacterium]
MIVVTGAAGFIGSNLIAGLNEQNYKDIILVDDFSKEEKRNNYKNKTYSELVQRDDFAAWLAENQRFVQIVIHMGARTDTAEFNWDTFLHLNLDYSKQVWKLCVEYGLPLIYASSAATYGLGEHGYNDSHELIPSLKPLNPYGRSKNEFDKWAIQQVRQPFFWAGLKFFNVYGPNEYHKGRMASVVYHAYNQIKETGKMKLFRSHHPEFLDGEQLRDFVYVKDVVDVILNLMETRNASGIFNLGTGEASTFRDLVTYTFEAMDVKPVIEFIDTPEDIRDKYQYFTEAEMGKLRSAGYTAEFTSLHDGVLDYVKNYLASSGIH